ITCRRAVAFAATAIAFASAISFSGEKCAQKKSYAKGCVGTFECFVQALRIVYVRSHNFSTQSCEILCTGSIHIPSEHPRSETTIRVVKDRPDQTTALGTGCSYHCDNFSVAHCDLPFGDYTEVMSQSVLTTRSVNHAKDVELYLYLSHRVEIFAIFHLALSG